MTETFDIKVEGESSQITLLPILDMSAADDFLDVVRKALSERNKITLDAKDVKRLSTPCVQIMLAAAKAAEEQNGSFKIQNITPDLKRGMDDLGVGHFLDNWSKEI